MAEEMDSMSRFQVYKRVPKSAANGRQILGCKWVYKRKTNKFGHVTRYRARLVAQGFRQREFDSFNPDDIHSPVVHTTFATFATFATFSPGTGLLAGWFRIHEF